MLEQAAGNWPAIRQLTGRVEQAIAANIATPCMLNRISLLICAVGHASIGQGDEAQRLERAAAALGMEGYRVVMDPLLARLALIRGDLPAVEAFLADSDTWWWTTFGHLSSLATRLDGFAALGRREDVEKEGARRGKAGTYLEPFALRALGQVRGDQALIDRAVDRFEALGLTWHAEQTRSITIGS